MMLRLSRMHFPVTVLGPGTRVGIWVQGCTLACKGCISRDTWAADDSRLRPLDEIMDYIRETASEATGVTISGGEPFQQPEALAELLDRLHAWRQESGREIDILCYSGYRYEWLKRRHAGILARLDVVMPAPFAQDKPTDLVWRGSSNQSLIPLTDLGHRRFDPFVDAVAEGPALQATVEDGVFWMVGVPREGEMDRFEVALRDRGIVMKEPPWST